MIRTNSKSGPGDGQTDADYRKYEIGGLFQLISGAGLRYSGDDANTYVPGAVARDRLQPDAVPMRTMVRTRRTPLSIKLLPATCNGSTVG